MNLGNLKSLKLSELNGSLKSYKEQWREHVKICSNCASSRVPARDMCDDGLNIRIWVNYLANEIARRKGEPPPDQAELF